MKRLQTWWRRFLGCVLWQWNSDGLSSKIGVVVQAHSGTAAQHSTGCTAHVLAETLSEPAIRPSHETRLMGTRVGRIRAFQGKKEKWK
jgi:hypothetical protein